MSNFSRLVIAAAAMVAASGAQANFEITFDEYGNGSYAIWNGAIGGYGPTVNDPGFLAADPTGTFGGNVLTYALPEIIGGGGLNINDSQGISDNLFFYNNGGGYMIFTSLRGGGAPADTGVIDFGFVGGYEAANETFTFVAGDGTVAGSNIYNGVSGVPEPSTWAMMLIGFAGLGFAGYRQSIKAKAASVAA